MVTLFQTILIKNEIKSLYIGIVKYTLNILLTLKNKYDV